MAATIKQTEGAPDKCPDMPSVSIVDLSPAIIGVIWQRIESYTAFRYSPRDVAWIVEGPGEWNPTLTPVIVDSVELWENGDWIDTTDLSASPYGGFFLPRKGPYRFAGTAGGGSPSPEVPEAIQEAFKRLVDYIGAKRGKPGASREDVTAGSVSISVSRSPSWLADAMRNSGAGDLLRPYRRA